MGYLFSVYDIKILLTEMARFFNEPQINTFGKSVVEGQNLIVNSGLREVTRDWSHT